MTLSTHGPGGIVLNSKLHSWMNIFVKEAIKYVWKKGGTEGSPSSIPFRKSAVSKVYTTNHSNELQGNLADLIVHNIKTACKFYACMHE
ncbi:unnamed protein product, partial [Pocillopora meandrina]